MEYLQLFDENKNMLDEKIERDNKLTLTGNKYFMIILLFIENEKGEFLLQRTNPITRDGKIATTGGHVTFGDDGLKTTIKEANEELGLTFKPEDLTYIDTVVFKQCYLEIYYTNKPINMDEIKLQEEEVESVDWYTIDEINEMIETGNFRKGNTLAFPKVLEYKNKVK